MTVRVIPRYVIIYDEYQQPWIVQEDDELYEEANKAVEKSSPEKVYWPLSKIVQNRGWGWWSVFHSMDEFEEELEKEVPNPSKTRQIDINKEYTPTELRDLLQHFGSYLSTLHRIEARVEAQAHALKSGFNTAMAVAAARSQSKSTTVSAREAEVLVGNELLKQTRRMQIDQEAMHILIKGWVASYEAAYTAISRIISIELGEVALQTGRHP